MANKLNRRDFNRICGSIVAGALAGHHIPVSASNRTTYAKTRLLGASKQPVTAESLETGVPYLFFYPFITTPCFLIDIGTATSSSALTDRNGNGYQWQGGVGPDKSIVAYSAICSHKMSHPAKEISFINYRHDPVSFYSHEGVQEERSGVISCCSERSVYDAAAGAQVLSGPAPQPLAAIELEEDQTTGALYATASYGGDMYEKFFEKFGFRASMEHRVTDPRQVSGEQTTIRKASNYSDQTIKC